MLKKNERQAEIKRKLKKNKRKRLTAFFISVVLILLLLAGSTFFGIRAYKTGFFNLKNIKIIGNKLVDDQFVIDAANIPDNQSIITLNINQIQSNIDNKLNLSEVFITHMFPNSIVIRMKEKTPMCGLIKDGNIFYINEDREIIGILDHVAKSNVTLISGFSVFSKQHIRNNITIDPEWRFDEIEKMLKLLNGSKYLEKISEISAQRNNSFEIITKNDISFIVSDFENFSENYDYIGTMLEKNYSGMEINLTIGSNPIIKER